MELVLSEAPRTRSSRRSMVIGQSTVLALRSSRATQAERRLPLGANWQKNDVVVDRHDGGFMDQDVVRTSFPRAVRRQPELPVITPHALRHTMATIMLGAGVNPKIVQERLGHSTIQMTLDRYSHVRMTMQPDAAAILDTLLSAEARPIRGQEAG